MRKVCWLQLYENGVAPSTLRLDLSPLRECEFADIGYIGEKAGLSGAQTPLCEIRRAAPEMETPGWRPR